MYSIDEKSFEKCKSIGEAYENHKNDIVSVLGYNPYTGVREWVKAGFVKTRCSELYKISFDDRAEWTSMIVTLDHIFPIFRNGKYMDVFAKDLHIEDRLLADKAQWNLLKNDCKEIQTVKISSIDKITEEQDVFCLRLLDNKSPYFVLSNGVITHNCRLRNEIAENVFSFTNGLTGVQTGSANVITLNLNRIVQDWYHENDVKPIELKDYLINILDRVYKYHIAYKTMLYAVEDAGMLNASTAGYINMHKLFSTIGINGLNEAAEFLGLKCNYNEAYKEFCRLITGTISEQNKKHSTKDFQFNTELVPAEGLSSKNYNWDLKDGYWIPSNRNLYNSYFYIASDENTSILEKFKLHGKEFTELLDGGVGLHCNLSEHLSKEQYLKLIDFAVKNGTSYFTFNIPNSQCDDCQYITKVPITKCPKCGSEHITQWTRVIGFMRPIKMFDSERYKEALTRIYHPANNLKC